MKDALYSPAAIETIKRRARIEGMVLAQQAASEGFREWMDFGPADDLSSGPGWVLNAIDSLIADEKEKL